MLIIVDYAETRTELRALLQEVAADERRVRVLLLARSAGKWWRRLEAGSPRVRQMVAQAGAEGISLTEQVATDKSDRKLVEEAVPHFAKALNVSPPQRFDVALGEGPHRILDLHAAALVVVLRSLKPDAGQITVKLDDVLQELLGHEQRYWVQSAEARGFFSETLDAHMVEQIVAAGTLLGAKDRDQAAQVVGRVPGVKASVVVADWLRELYPPDDDREWLGRLRPDRLAELHITRKLDESPQLLTACLNDLDDRQIRRALVTLGRAAHELEAARKIIHQRILPVISGETEVISVPRDALVALYEALPHPSVVLSETRALLARRILETTPANAEPQERARWLTNLGVHFSDLGRHDEALTVEQEAVSVYRELAQAYPSPAP